MATDSANGYVEQYGQPAELAASTPSHQTSASVSSTVTNSQTPKPDPQEIGWYFVEQYYTTLSKNPDKISLFYNKKSQLVTGKEAEKVIPAFGSKAIGEKIRSLDISECKVRVLNVDSQLSYDNIVVQVIGELSNKGEPHHKFVQTFVLATQPGGYFVLNDIFRYLNEDEDEIVDDEPAQPEPEVVSEAPAEVEPQVEEAATEQAVTTDATIQQVDEKLEAAKEEEEAHAEEPVVNGTTEEETPEITTEEAVEAVQAEEPDKEVEAPTEDKPVEPAPTPAAEPPKPEPVASGPPKKMTWASMVGVNKPAQQPALPQPTATLPAQPAATKRPVTQAQPAKAVPSESAADAAVSQSNGWQTAESGKKKGAQAKAQEGIVHAYIKNVLEKIDARTLRETLEKFGELKYYDVSRPKQCAFVEFADPAAYQAAHDANPHVVNGEEINVEERRPRPGQNGFAGQTRGAFTGSRGRGNNMNQRTNSQGRGGYPSRGGKNGAAGATRGRGQVTA